jgi:hypothetical protein
MRSGGADVLKVPVSNEQPSSTSERCITSFFLSFRYLDRFIHFGFFGRCSGVGANPGEIRGALQPLDHLRTSYFPAQN